MHRDRFSFSAYRFLVVTSFVAVGMTLSAPASALVGFSNITASHVVDAATDLGNGTWRYDYTVYNDATCVGFCLDTVGGLPINVPDVVSWDLPWANDASIPLASITSPTGWAYSIETVGVANAATGWGGVAQWQDPADPNYQGAGSGFNSLTQVLHWYDASGTHPVLDADSAGPSFLAGFGFTSVYGPTYAPYQAAYVGTLSALSTGDPVFPNAPSVAPVPEPSAWVLLLLGLGMVGLVRVRRAPSSRLFQRQCSTFPNCLKKSQAK